MAIASFASKIFNVSGTNIYTFQDLQYSSSIQTEKQDAAGTKPSTYDKGPDLDNMSFTIKLDITFGVNPRSEWEDWKNILNSGITYPFILGGRPLSRYNFKLISVTPSNFNIDNKGNILALDLELKFDEYVREGSASSSSSSSSKTKSKSSSTSVDGLSDTEFASLVE